MRSRRTSLFGSSTLILAQVLLLAACSDQPVVPDAGSHSVLGGSGDGQPSAGLSDGPKKVVPPVAPEEAPTPSPRLANVAPVEELARKVDTYFSGHIGRQLYLQIDKPLYKPGESIWVRTWDLRTRDLAGAPANAGVVLELVSPKGSVVMTKGLAVEAGFATNDFELPEEIAGGEYTLRAHSMDGVVSAERPIVVNTYEAPRVKKTLEFLRKAYGEGDEVTATIEVKRPTGEPLANKALTALVRLDNADLPRVALTTDAQGGGLVRFKLPASIATGDGLLTVMVEDGGVTESISKRIPIIVRKMQLAFFPEGGALVEGIASRLYFEAKTPLGKPADVEGKIVDELGNTVQI
jgi:hypothetical protein